MKPRFKRPEMQALYDLCRKLGTDRSSLFWLNGRPARAAGLRGAYWSGFDGEPARWLRTSLRYAAWAAGRDDERAGR